MDQAGLQDTRQACAQAAVIIGQAVREAINAIALEQRTLRTPSLLKPAPAVAAWPDVEGERVALRHLEVLAAQTGFPIRLVYDPEAGLFHEVGAPSAAAAATAATAAATAAMPGDAMQQGPIIWCYLDAVDGTLKLSGLDNQPGRLRLVNDGSWGIGAAFTDPTAVPLAQLTLGDFSVVVIVDGNPSPAALHPAAAVAVKGAAAGAAAALAPAAAASPPGGVVQQASGSDSRNGNDGSSGSGGVYEAHDPASGVRLHTTTCTKLHQTFVHMDCFQAYDRASAAPGDEGLACALHAALSNRHEGGAFDVHRSYGNLSALLRGMFGWRGHIPLSATVCEGGSGSSGGGTGAGIASSGAAQAAAVASAATPEPIWVEAQTGAYICINENLANMLPAVPLILGAGGVATDLEGRPLAARRLAQGRTSVLYSANAALHEQVLALVARCRPGADDQL